MMIVCIDIKSGPHKDDNVTKADVDKNINALDRAINRKMLSCDDILLIDTKSILEQIKSKLVV